MIGGCISAGLHCNPVHCSRLPNQTTYRESSWLPLRNACGEGHAFNIDNFTSTSRGWEVTLLASGDSIMPAGWSYACGRIVLARLRSPSALCYIHETQIANRRTAPTSQTVACCFAACCKAIGDPQRRSAKTDSESMAASCQRYGEA